MRIVHVEDRFHPGMGYQVNYMARYHDTRHEFIIVTSDSTSIWNHIPPGQLDEMDRTFEKEFQVRIIRLPARMAGGQKSNIWIRGLIRNIRQLQPDALYTHCIENYSSMRILRTFSAQRVRMATDTHTLENQFMGGIKEQLYFLFLKKFIVPRINKYSIKTFYTTTENKQILTSIYGIEPRLLYSSPIGTDLNNFKFDPEARAIIRKQYEIPGNAVVLLYTGKINARKKPHLILQAVEKIEELISIPLVLFFVGPREDHYASSQFTVGFKNPKIRVIETGAVPNDTLFRYYSMADLAVFPYENTLSSLDAQACHLPVIMQEDLTNSERLQEGGLVYRKGDIQDLAEKIHQLYLDGGMRARLASAGSVFVERHYNYKHIIRKTEEIFLGESIQA